MLIKSLFLSINWLFINKMPCLVSLTKTTNLIIMLCTLKGLVKPNWYLIFSLLFSADSGCLLKKVGQQKHCRCLKLTPLSGVRLKNTRLVHQDWFCDFNQHSYISFDFVKNKYFSSTVNYIIQKHHLINPMGENNLKRKQPLKWQSKTWNLSYKPVHNLEQS